MRELPSRDDAQALARRLLISLESRWDHTCAVAARASLLSKAVSAVDQDLLVVAAWCHDLGYAPTVAATGFHALDGAQFLSVQGYPARLCGLVANHSAATFEAEERDLIQQLAQWPNEQDAVADALWTADMTTGPNGESVDYETRFDEILRRYDVDSAVARAMTRARPTIQSAIRRTEHRLATTS